VAVGAGAAAREGGAVNVPICSACNRPVATDAVMACKGCAGLADAYNAEVNAHATTSAELAALSDHVRTVADEETGPHPIISAAEAMKHISKALFERRRRIGELEAQEKEAVRQIGEIDERLKAMRADVVALVDQRDAARREAEELRGNVHQVCLAHQHERETRIAVEARAERLEAFAREVAASYTIREAPGIGTDAGWYEADGTTWIDLRERARRAMGDSQ
jgi:hypothetical protein